jgi:hypothetical protein
MFTAFLIHTFGRPRYSKRNKHIVEDFVDWKMAADTSKFKLTSWMLVLDLCRTNPML